MTSPNGAVPQGAYVSGGTGQAAITDLNGLTEDVAKSRMKAPVGPWSGAQGNFWSNILKGFSDVIAAARSVVIGMVKGLFDLLANLLGDTAQQMAKQDVARRDGEVVIANNMRAGVEFTDEIVRTGGAYMLPTNWRLGQGDNAPHVMPLTDGFVYSDGTNNQYGTRMIAPVERTITDGWAVNGSTPEATEAYFQQVARNSGQLELLEGGFWLIFFQTAFRLYDGVGGLGAGAGQAWCFVTPSSSDWLPAATPNGSTVGCRNRVTGAAAGQDLSGFVLGYGRTTSYAGTAVVGGYTSFGMVPVALPSGGYKVNLAVQADYHFGGPASTYVWAFKVNSKTLRADIDAFKSQVSTQLPRPAVDALLTDAKVNALRVKIATDVR